VSYDNEKPNMETPSSEVFNELSPQDQKVAIDIAVATILLGVRLPGCGQQLFYDFIAAEFTSSYTLSSNVAKYALRSLAKTLLEQDWVLTIKKEKGKIVTSFTPEPIKNDGANNEMDRT
jgi:hypothetical protein